MFHGVRWLKWQLQTLVVFFGRAFGPSGRVVFRGLIVPGYRVVVMFKLKMQRMIVPARGIVLFFISNRYLFHMVLATAVIATVVVNLVTRQAHAQDVGQHSVLYALVTDSPVEIVNETASADSQPVSAQYMSGALVAMPHIDFDYEEEPPLITDSGVPGAISAGPVITAERPATPTATQTPRALIEPYTVKDGDTIASIAQNFGVNVGTILWSNNLNERQYIRPGDVLKIPSVSGLIVAVKKGDTLGALASRYDGDAEEVRQYNHISDAGALASGMEVVIPGGRPPATQENMVAIASRNKPVQIAQTRPSTSNSQGNEDTLNEGSNAEDVVPHAATPSATPKPSDVDTSKLPSGKLLWPTTGHVITQYYGWRHTGIDIDGDFTSPLLAAYDGVVEKAGWNSGGYGLMILIQHPNGMTTRYGHASKLFVKEGDTVKRGQVIAMMGSTGRSTGSHLHFEVYVKGVRTNPLAYIR